MNFVDVACKRIWCEFSIKQRPVEIFWVLNSRTHTFLELVFWQIDFWNKLQRAIWKFNSQPFGKTNLLLGLLNFILNWKAQFKLKKRVSNYFLDPRSWPEGSYELGSILLSALPSVLPSHCPSFRQFSWNWLFLKLCMVLEAYMKVGVTEPDIFGKIFFR